MMTRDTVRILLFHGSTRLLLMRVINPAIVDPSGHLLTGRSLWATIGGKLEQHETYRSAALRELWEETGIEGASLDSVGPAIWSGEQVLIIAGEETLLRETFFVMRTFTSNITSAFHTSEEKRVIKEMRWWTIDEIESTEEFVLPWVLRQLVRDAAEGRYPSELLRISLSASNP